VFPRPNFSIDEAVTTLYDAFNMIGSDEAAVTEVLATHSSEQRQQLKSAYRNVEI
jgi:hypothetical protein